MMNGRWILLFFLMIGLPTGSTHAAGELVLLGGESYLYEVVRHLYRWHLDESDIENVLGDEHLDFQLQRLNVDLDEGDHSVFVQIALPALNITTVVKKADYRIEELDLAVKSEGFKISRVGTFNAEDLSNPVHVKINMKAMRDYLFKTRNQKIFPDEALTQRLRKALLKQFESLLDDVKVDQHTTYVAPLSPVANEIWTYWETGRRLIRIASDIDLKNPAVWKHDSLHTKVYDVDQQVVVSLSEVPGSNAYLTRDQVGRALYNCIVLGEKRTPSAADLK